MISKKKSLQVVLGCDLKDTNLTGFGVGAKRPNETLTRNGNKMDGQREGCKDRLARERDIRRQNYHSG